MGVANKHYKLYMLLGKTPPIGDALSALGCSPIIMGESSVFPPRVLIHVLDSSNIRLRKETKITEVAYLQHVMER